MNSFVHIDGSQHAYLVIGEKENAVREINKAVEVVFQTKLAGNPDYRESCFETLGIDEARELKEEQSRRALGGKEKFFVVCAGALTREAQNALLKVFEEPTEGTYIFLVVRSTRQVLPTLLSRVRVLEANSEKRMAKSRDAKIFFETSAEKRLQLPFIKKLLEDKEKQEVISFFDAIEEHAHEIFSKTKMPELADFFVELIRFRGYAGDRSSSVKMLLEHVALTAPVLK